LIELLASKQVRPIPSLRRLTRLAVGTDRRREIVIVAIGSALLAIVMTWPTLARPRSTIPDNLGDPVYQTWAMAWFAHAIFSQPLHAFHGNAFWPLEHSLAYTDLSPSLSIFAIGVNDPADALVRYNIAFVLAATVNVIGAYALARQLGSGPAGAAVAGTAFAFAPWRISHWSHLAILFTGGIPLTFALLLRGHGIGRRGWRPECARPGAALAGWAVAVWQVGIGFAIGLSFVYSLMLTMLAGAIGWVAKGRPRLPRRLLWYNVAGGLVFAAVVVGMGSVLLSVVREFPEATSVRQVDALQKFSPPISGLFTAAENSAVWGGPTESLRRSIRWPWEMALFPGLLVTVLAMLGIAVSAWTVRRRLWLLAGVILSVVLALGTTFLGGDWTWLPVRTLLPGMDSVRSSGRLVFWALLGLSLLAAGAVTRVDEAVRKRGVVLRTPLFLLPVLLSVEGMSSAPHPAVPRSPVVLRSVRAPVLVLPSRPTSDVLAMLWSTRGFYRLGNGVSSFLPNRYVALTQATATFPDRTSIAYLRMIGFRSVVMPLPVAHGTPWEAAAHRSIEGLPVRREASTDGVVFTLT
jgi:hypothetical protein